MCFMAILARLLVHISLPAGLYFGFAFMSDFLSFVLMLFCGCARHHHCHKYGLLSAMLCSIHCDICVTSSLSYISELRFLIILLCSHSCRYYNTRHKYNVKRQFTIPAEDAQSGEIKIYAFYVDCPHDSPKKRK